MGEINKGFYAIIPASIRYDNEIPSNAKLFYAEITALCNEKGYCWANNEYFAELYDVSDRTICRWISILCQKGYITTEYQFKTGTKEILKRYIKLAGNTSSAYEEKLSLGGDKNVSTYRQNCHLGGDKNVVDNNINNNNIYNKNILSGSEGKSVDNLVDNSSKEDGKSLIINEIITYLNIKCNTEYKNSSEKTRKCIHARLNEGYSLIDFKKVIDTKAAEWLNTDMAKYLRPETLFGSKFEGYLNQRTITTKVIKQQKPTNKFHNFIQGEEIDLEALVEKKREQRFKELAAKRGIANEG